MVTQDTPLKDTPAMMALQSFDFLEKPQNDYESGRISFSEYALVIRDWLQRKKDEDACFWYNHGENVITVAKTVAQGMLMDV